MNKAFGLSLSDQYWLNPVSMPMKWDDINFFDHDFNSQDYLEATFENKVLDTHKVDFYTPNNTSDGMLKKAWIVGKHKKRYLLKGSYNQKQMEPFNEVLASMICKVLNIDYVSYTIEVRNHTLLSKCECFIDKDTEFISAYAILKYSGISFTNQCGFYEEYVSILEKNGIKDVEEKLAKMFILDYIIVNKDRHLGDFGVIRNVNTLKWQDIAPNFDSGQAMYSQKEVDFDTIYNKAIKDKDVFIDFKKLYKVADERIEVLYHGLKLRIQKLEERVKA